MTTSGSTDFNETALQLITNALTLIGYLAAGETVQTNDLTFGMNTLNAMVKAWMGQGIHLWTEETGTLFLTNGQYQYNLQTGASGAKASDGSGTPVETTLSAQAGSGASTVTLTTATGVSSGDNIGICLNDNTIFWTTVNGAPSGNVVTLTATTSGPANSGNAVYTYTTQMPRALSIQSARLRNNSGFDKIMEIKPRNDYMNIPEKAISGSPIILAYSPQLTKGIVYVWPAPNQVQERIEFTYLRQIEDFDSSSDNPDFPQEWLEAITYNLAIRMAPAYGINLNSGGVSGNPDLLRQAAQYLEDMKAWDAEQPYLQIVPKISNTRGY